MQYELYNRDIIFEYWIPNSFNSIFILCKAIEWFSYKYWARIIYHGGNETMWPE